MKQFNYEEIRNFRLRSHHLDKFYPAEKLTELVGACGFQNSPPDAWQEALHNRTIAFSKTKMKEALEEEKILVQAWSFRGTPVVFPTLESRIFLPTLIPLADEPWIYTKGIQLALDYLQMDFDQVWQLLQKVIHQLDTTIIESKTRLDQTIAEWVADYLPKEKKSLWNALSMYGNPQKQTVGGAAVSFLLRPCAFQGQVVFAKRHGRTPSFTSYKNLLGEELELKAPPVRQLLKKFLHCYGPTDELAFANWLGCSPQQAKRMWQTIVTEIVPVTVADKKQFILEKDLSALATPVSNHRTFHLLKGHDPYLGLQDRHVILADSSHQRVIWQTVANPGAILFEGAIIGYWKTRSKGTRLEAELTIWQEGFVSKQMIEAELERYAKFKQQTLSKISFN